MSIKIKLLRRVTESFRKVNRRQRRITNWSRWLAYT